MKIFFFFLCLKISDREVWIVYCDIISSNMDAHTELKQEATHQLRLVPKNRSGKFTSN